MTEEQVLKTAEEIHSRYDEKFKQQMKQLHFWSVVVLIITALVLIAVPLAEKIIYLAVSGNVVDIGILIFSTVLVVSGIILYCKKYYLKSK